MAGTMSLFSSLYLLLILRIRSFRFDIRILKAILKACLKTSLSNTAFYAFSKEQTSTCSHVSCCDCPQTFICPFGSSFLSLFLLVLSHYVSFLEGCGFFCHVCFSDSTSLFITSLLLRLPYIWYFNCCSSTLLKINSFNL